MDTRHRLRRRETFSQNLGKSMENPHEYSIPSLQFNTGGANRIPHFVLLTFNIVKRITMHKIFQALSCFMVACCSIKNEVMIFRAFLLT